ncbi:hypothetical protein [Acrocarpospora sp. B8E8]|uniref:hypothetical protein n=1 Tax=Acrocarpospora sp. B8E8 TaxID=3153572 RepID=UPI00325DCE9E
MGDESNGVVVTFKDMYDELRHLVTEVRELTHELKDSRADSADHENRIRALEQWRYALPASLLLGLGSLAAQFLK